jgi:hypothetical protein
MLWRREREKRGKRERDSLLPPLLCSPPSKGSLCHNKRTATHHTAQQHLAFSTKTSSPPAKHRVPRRERERENGVQRAKTNQKQRHIRESFTSLAFRPRAGLQRTTHLIARIARTRRHVGDRHGRECRPFDAEEKKRADHKPKKLTRVSFPLSPPATHLSSLPQHTTTTPTV